MKNKSGLFIVGTSAEEIILVGNYEECFNRYEMEKHDYLKATCEKDDFVYFAKLEKQMYPQKTNRESYKLLEWERLEDEN